ncbi:MAG: class III poly(R)-hydroxyalkanoic acid synthase subunit PhaC [Clostridia bacterium]|jgi:polyhydroxyalkanoate synthase|nr:class III poly(R)-hydroxyalkanoic acid synthase subunit PhaC [Clostridia bacterium]
MSNSSLNFYDGKAYADYMASALKKQQKMADGLDVLMNIQYDERYQTPKELVYEEDKMKVFHYLPVNKKKKAKVPTLVVYAMMNRPYIMDLQREKSFVKKLLEEGLDLYILDWGYPTAEDRYITLEDYIEGYLGNAVDYIRETTGVEQINILSKCQGGTYCAIYTSLYPEKVKNLVTIAAPFTFDIEDGLLFKWAKNMDVDSLVDAYGVVPGEFLNACFVSLKPYSLLVDKYIAVINSLDDPGALKDFMSVEAWLFDSPGQVGEAYRKYMKDLWQENKLAKGEFYLGEKKVDLKNITMPLLNVVGEKDNLIPPSAAVVLNDMVGSADKELVSYPVGHAGIVASGLSQREVAPKVARWLLERSK